MTTRIFFAGILGGIVLFIWNFVAHDLLPLGEMGARIMTNEDAVTGALQTEFGDTSGFYIFPSGGLNPGATGEQKHAWMEKPEEPRAAWATRGHSYVPKRTFDSP